MITTQGTATQGTATLTTPQQIKVDVKGAVAIIADELNPLPPELEMLYAGNVGKSSVTLPIRLNLRSEGDEAIVTWVDGNIEARGRSLGDALSAFEGLLSRT
jgi:hypothetical protein